MCYNDINVIHNTSEWRYGKYNLLMLMEDVPPGYCRLQQLRDDVPEPVERLPDDQNYCYDDQEQDIVL